MSSFRAKIGIIGGSGLYHIAGFTAEERIKLTTPFGDPSDEYICGHLGGHAVAFLPRHGQGHRLLPSELPHRANIHGMKQLGVEWIISVSAVGSLKEECAPGDVVLPDQFFDRTKGRLPETFFGEGIVAHVSMADPISLELQEVIAEAAATAGGKVHRGGTYVNMEGPAFSTKAESNFHRQCGFTVVGMTNLTEAKLAREAEIAYCTIAMVTDYDCWHEGHESVTVQAVIECLHRNIALAQKIIVDAVPRVAKLPPAKAHSALNFAILTDKKVWPETTYRKLELLLSKYR